MILGCSCRWFGFSFFGFEEEEEEKASKKHKVLNFSCTHMLFFSVWIFFVSVTGACYVMDCFDFNLRIIWISTIPVNGLSDVVFCGVVGRLKVILLKKRMQSLLL